MTVNRQCFQMAIDTIPVLQKQLSKACQQFCHRLQIAKVTVCSTARRKKQDAHMAHLYRRLRVKAPSNMYQACTAFAACVHRLGRSTHHKAFRDSMSDVDFAAISVSCPHQQPERRLSA